MSQSVVLPPRSAAGKYPMASFFAFLHHIAAFALVAALVGEFVLIRDAKRGRAPIVLDHKMRSIRSVIHWGFGA